VVVLDEAEDIFCDEYRSPFAPLIGERNDSKAWMNGLLETNKHPTIWISNRIEQMDPAYVRRFTYCLEFPRTPRGVRNQIAHQHLAPLDCPPEVLDGAASDPAVSPAMLSAAARFVRLGGFPKEDVGPGVELMLGDMVKALGQRLQSHVAPRLTPFDTRYLHVQGPITPDAVLKGIAHGGRGRVLLDGPPGTGKTQFAAEIARRLGRELVYRTASDVNSMWFGQSERNVARMFDECDTQGEVLFLDEADTLLAGRSSSSHRAEVAVTAEFLRHVEAFPGIFVCATNFGTDIDAALLRRFEFRLHLRPLTLEQRLDMFASIAFGWQATSGQPRPVLPPAIRDGLAALPQLTPGDFANVLRRVTALGLTLDPSGWMAELQSEHDVKPGARRGSILYPNAGPLLNISQEEIGELAGLSRPTTNSALKRLEEVGLVSISYGALLVTNLEALREFSQAVDSR
jgi:CRP-like cAMP-binding protein